jgi:dimethylargininase
MFTKAIVKTPGPTFAEGQTTVELGPPDLDIATLQHSAYCNALRQCGLLVIRLEAEPQFPDSTFVEDVAVLTDRLCVIARPGALSRRGEIVSVGRNLMRYFGRVGFVPAPGRLDGGDVLQIGDRFVIGISERTSEDGAYELARQLSAAGYETAFLDIRGIDGLLHLKSGVSYLGDHRILSVEAIADETVFDGLEVVRVPAGEEYAANCIRVNDYVLMPAGYPGCHRLLEGLGYKLIMLEMSEFRKMDGGLSCLSLRF